ncbi:MAG TPA: tetratricopeptide repeat protein [Cytophagales bacterium]|nr:tetratricopeptide repeat protein [Cytophagales bacterium]
MRLVFLFILFYAYSFQFCTASGKVDSLIQQLQNANPTNYREVIKDIEVELEAMKPDSSLEKVKELNVVTSSMSFFGPVSATYRFAAIAYERNGQSVKAIQLIEKAIRVSKNNELTLETADNLKTLGWFYHNSGKFTLALKNYYQALSVFEQKENDKKNLYLLYSYLGDIYYKTQHYNRSQDYLKKAYLLGKKYLDNSTLINALNTMALIHRNNEEYEEAIDYHREALRLAKFSRDSIWEGTANGNIGRIFQLQKKYDYALLYFHRGLELSEKFKDWSDVIITMSRIADVHLQKKQYSTAKEFLNRALKIAEREKEYPSKVFLYEVLARYYKNVNQYSRAFDYQKLYAEVKDSIERKSFNEEIDQIRSSFEIEKKESQIELLSKKNKVITASEEKKNFMLLITTVLLLLVVVVIVMLYRSNMEKVKAVRQLEEQKVKLNDKNEEINVLNNTLENMVQERTQQLQEAMENLVKQNHNLEQFSYVISHNLRAPIAHILGLASIFNKKDLKDKENLKIINHLKKAALNLDEIVGDLNNILLIRDHSPDSNEEICLADVAELTIESLRKHIEACQALIYTDFSEAEVLFSNKSYLNSILYNLLSNAIKYKSEDRNPEILIKSTKVENYTCIMIKDNGVGILLTKSNSQKLFMLYQRLHEQGEGKGMGLFVVKEQIESLKGKIEVESEPDKGTTFKVYFPIC